METRRTLLHPSGSGRGSILHRFVGKGKGVEFKSFCYGFAVNPKEGWVAGSSPVGTSLAGAPWRVVR